MKRREELKLEAEKENENERWRGEEEEADNKIKLLFTFSSGHRSTNVDLLLTGFVRLTFGEPTGLMTGHEGFGTVP
jgi:hypothetical protein